LLSCGDDLLNAISDHVANLLTARLRRPIGIDQKPINAAEALPLRERIDLDLCQVDWFRKVFQGQRIRVDIPLPR
jgi:hypothetical protein